MREKHWIDKFNGLQNELNKLYDQVNENNKQCLIPPRKFYNVKTIGLQTDLTITDKNPEHEQKVKWPAKLL